MINRIEQKSAHFLFNNGVNVAHKSIMCPSGNFLYCPFNLIQSTFQRLMFFSLKCLYSKSYIYIHTVANVSC